MESEIPNYVRGEKNLNRHLVINFADQKPTVSVSFVKRSFSSGKLSNVKDDNS